MNRFSIIAAILIVGFVSRVIPHAWDFTPVLALAMFAGANLTGRQRFIVPVALMAITDLALGFYPSFLITWVGVVAAVAIGTFLRGSASWVRLGACSLASATVFFIISNFGVWLTDYPKTWAGLADCYTLALPFFRNSLASTALYSVALIGGYARYARWAAARQTTTQHT